MDDIENLEEPPPIHRTAAQANGHSHWNAGLLGRHAQASGSPQGVDISTTTRRRSRKGLLAALAVVSVLSAQGWLLYETRSDLNALRATVGQAQTSLGQVWESTKQLDADRMARLALLADSIRSVFDYAQGEVRLWEASYSTLGQRLDENVNTLTRMSNGMRSLNTRLEGFARADVAQRTRLEALERYDRTQSTAFEALARRAVNQEATTHDVSATVGTIRETLGKLDSELAGLEQRLNSSTSAYGQLGRRVDNLAGFADGFRRAGLSGDALQGQLASLADEVRRIRMQVDSLRPVGTRTMISSSLR